MTDADRGIRDEGAYAEARRRHQRRGLPEKEAAEAAVRTVNEQRMHRGLGRAESPRPRNPVPGRRTLETLSMEELYELARSLDLAGRSRMDRDALVAALRAALA